MSGEVFPFPQESLQVSAFDSTHLGYVIPSWVRLVSLLFLPVALGVGRATGGSSLLSSGVSGDSLIALL